MWTKSAQQRGREVQLEQLGSSAAIGRYAAVSFRGLTTGLVLGGIAVAFYKFGFLTGVITAVVLVGVKVLAFKKR